VETNSLPRTNPDDQSRANDNEQHNRKHLHQREPILELPKPSYLQSVDGHKPGGHSDDPNPLRNAGEPEREVNRDGSHFRTNRDDLYQRVGGTDGKPSPAVYVSLSINTERTSHWVNHGHFRDRVGNNHGDYGAQKVGDDDGRARESYRYAAAEKQSNTNGATDRQHAQLPLRQLSTQFFARSLSSGAGSVGLRAQ